MSFAADARWFGLIIASFLLSAAITWLSIRYARRRNLIDQPGQRRSHCAPTPRGGGIGITVAALAIFAVETTLLPAEARVDLLACIAAIGLVGLVGWIDDHGGLAARWRILAHAAAAGILLASGLGFSLMEATGIRPEAPAAAQILVLAGIGVAVVWSINLHNFMDGIDGILAWQCLFVFLALTVLTASVGYDADAWHLLALAAAVAGFLPFNAPRARVFMGDVGSGVLGLLVAIAVLRQMDVDEVWPLSGAIACSAFVVDASCNLVSRMLRGRRWYSAHREHLYQWMVRTGMSHPRVVAWYAGWNLLLVAPVLWQSNRSWRMRAVVDQTLGVADIGWLLAVYGTGIALWIFGKRWCLHTVKARHGHAAA